jgi:hypothetical protein
MKRTVRMMQRTVNCSVLSDGVDRVDGMVVGWLRSEVDG